MKTPFLFLPILLAGCLPAATALGATVTEIYSSGPMALDIPDNGIVLTPTLRRITDSSITSLSDVRVHFRLVGTGPDEGWAADMYASLIRSEVFVAPAESDPYAVLLNQVGVNPGNPAGYGYDGWDATFSDAVGEAIQDRFESSGILDGTFQPDGRSSLLIGDRDAMLSGFDGLPGNGDWWLALGDLETGGTMRLESWTLTLVGESAAVVPEGEVAWGWGVLALVAAPELWRRVRRRCASS